ncbi:N-acetyltransferase [Clostridia bacterium]|nr:N-acetyltransferase [Clostridia bacterium]
MKVIYREIRYEEFPVLAEFLYHAVFVPPGTAPLPRDTVYKPEIHIYIDGFGQKEGDICAVAESAGQILGAAWTRIIPAFGHIDDRTPELAVSVLPDCRGRGIGGALLSRLFGLLKEKGYRQTSLSVQKENPAARLYVRAGYGVVRENAEDYIMLKRIG